MNNTSPEDSLFPSTRSELRQLAEERVRERPTKLPADVSDLPADKIRRMLNELEVTQEEVKIQNEELLRVRRELEESRERYRDLYVCAPLGYLTLDADGKILNANLTATTLLRQDRSQILGSGITAFVHPESRQQLEQQLTSLVSGTAGLQCDIVIRRPDGSCRDVHVVSNASPAEPDHDVQFRIILTDITERKKTEQLLQHSEQRLRLALDFGRAGIWDWNMETGEVNWSAGLFSLLGYAPEEIEPTYDAWARRVDPDDLVSAEAAIEHARTSRGEYLCDYRVAHTDGTIRWVRGRGRFRYSATGSAVQMYGVLVDIDDQRQLQKDLRIRDRAVAASSQGVLITDPTRHDNPIIYCNPAFEKITGYSRDEVIGRNCRFLQGTDRDQEPISELRGAIDEGREINVVLRNYRKDGTMFWNELSISPVRNNDGMVTHIVGIQNDITNRIQAQQALTEKESQLVTIADALPVLISYLDLNMRHGFANAVHYQWFGLTPEQLQGMRFQDVIGDEKFRIWSPHLENAFAGNYEEYDCQLVHQADGLRTVLVKLVPDRRTDGTVIGVHYLIKDVTNRRIVERQTKQLEAFKQLLKVLTDDERKVYDLLIEGMSNRDIANELDIGLRTVERRRKNILDKMKADSLTEILKRLSAIAKP